MPIKSVISLVFFVTYIIFQPPSTILVRKLGPRIHLAMITLLWGACMVGMGFVKKWEDMAGLRVVLGILEAGRYKKTHYTCVDADEKQASSRAACTC